MTTASVHQSVTQKELSPMPYLLTFCFVGITNTSYSHFLLAVTVSSDRRQQDSWFYNSRDGCAFKTVHSNWVLGLWM